MDALHRVSRARAWLVLNSPFFATLAMDMGAEIVGSDVTETMATDGKGLFVNPAFVAECSDAELRGVIAHEVMHVALCHHTRRGARDPKLWNVATDYAINGELVAEGFTLPDGALIDARFTGKSADAIYAELHQAQPPGGGGGQKPGGGGTAGGGAPGQIGDILDAAPQSDAAALKAAELEAKAKVIQAANVAKAAGAESVMGKRLAAEARAPVVDWRATLRRFVDESARKDYAWHRPNRRFLGAGIYLPGMVPDGLSRLGVLIDVSGSIDARAFAAFWSELSDAVDVVQPDAVDVVQCDTAVLSAQTFGPGDALQVTPLQGGGTDMRPGIAHLADAQPAAIVVFTDCEFPRSRPVKDPGVPVLWARWGGGGTVPSFGELIDIA